MAESKKLSLAEYLGTVSITPRKVFVAERLFRNEGEKTLKQWNDTFKANSINIIVPSTKN